MIAYEPVWAIGTGMAASADDAQAAGGADPRRPASSRFGDGARRASRSSTAGSVTADNAAEFFAEPDIDGALVGGASLKVDEFAAIVACRGRRARARGERRDRGRRPRASSTASASATIRGATRSWRRDMPSLAPAPRRRGRSCQLEASGAAVGLPAGQMGNWRSGTSTSGPAFPCSRTCRASAARSRTARSSTNPVRWSRPRGMPRWRRARLHLMGLIGPGGVHALDRAHRRGRMACARRGAACRARPAPCASPMGATRRRARRPSFLPDARGAARRRIRRTHRDSRAAATTRWTATSAGIASGSPTTPSSTAVASTRRAARRRSHRPTRAARRDEFIRPTVIGDYDRDRADGDAVDPPQLPRRPGTAAHPGAGARRLRRLRPRLAPAGPQVATLTEYQDRRAAGGGRLPAARRSTRSRPICRGRGWRQLHVAETEKYAHVTYFFNGGVEEPFAGRGADAGAVEPRRRDLRPRARDERDGDHRRAGRRRSRAAASTSSSPTTPTRTWSATPASGTRPCAPPRSSTAASRASSTADPRRRRRRAASSPPTTATSRRCATRQGSRRPSTPPHPVPFLLVGERRRGARLRDGVLADVAPTLCELSACRSRPGMTGRSLAPRASGEWRIGLLDSAGHDASRSSRRSRSSAIALHRLDPAPAAWRRASAAPFGGEVIGLPQPPRNRADALPVSRSCWRVLFVIFSLLNLVRLQPPSRVGSARGLC